MIDWDLLGLALGFEESDLPSAKYSSPRSTFP